MSLMLKILIALVIGTIIGFNLFQHSKKELAPKPDIEIDQLEFEEIEYSQTDDETYPEKPTFNPLLPNIAAVKSNKTGIAEVTISFPNGTPDPQFYFEKVGGCAESYPVQCTFNLKWNESVKFTSPERSSLKFSVNLPEVTGYERGVIVTLQGPQNKLTARY